MTKHLTDVDPIAQHLASVIRGLADEEVNRRVAEKVAALASRQRSRDERLMEACRAVAAAVDRLDADKYTRREIAARQKVTLAAERLRNLMLGKPAEKKAPPRRQPAFPGARARPGRYTPGPSQRAILQRIADERTFRATEQRHLVSCLRLHVNGLLDRDAKDGSLFLANAKGVAWVRAFSASRGAPAAAQPAAPPLDNNSGGRRTADGPQSRPRPAAGEGAR